MKSTCKFPRRTDSEKSVVLPSIDLSDSLGDLTETTMRTSQSEGDLLDVDSKIQRKGSGKLERKGSKKLERKGSKKILKSKEEKEKERLEKVKYMFTTSSTHHML